MMAPMPASASTRRERPRSRSADQRDELAASHSITSVSFDYLVGGGAGMAGMTGMTAEI
jgi:hypothetical protein